jgi:4-amino-4-deoxy-L-arabinose transferase-like glycosyltransferase
MTGFQKKTLIAVLLVMFALFAHVFIIPPYMRDDVIYHLLVPKQLFTDGGFRFDPYNINTNFPMAFEMPLTLTFLTNGWVSPFLANYLVLFCLCCAFYGMARRVFAVNHLLALSAMILLATTPVVYDQLRSCYVELFMSLLVLMAFYNYYLFRIQRDRTRYWYLTMLFAGMLCSVKYTGGVFLIFLLGVEFFAGRDRALYYRGALAGAAVCLPWYLKNWILLGNPVFPLLAFLFPSKYVSVERAIFYKHLFADYHAGRTWIDYLLLPWRLLTGYTPPFEAGRLGFGGQLSFFFICAFASVGALFKRDDTSPLASYKRVVGLLFLCYAVFWALTSQQVRFLLPVSILAALSGLSMINDRWKRLKIPTLVIFALILLQNLINIGSIMKNEKITDLIAGRISREQFLDHHMPISHKIAGELNRILNPRSDRLLAIGNFGRNFYYDVEVLTNTYDEAEIFARAFHKGKIQPQIFENFVKTHRITHLLINQAYLNQFFSSNTAFDMAALNQYLRRFPVVLKQNAAVVYDLRLLAGH